MSCVNMGSNFHMQVNTHAHTTQHNTTQHNTTHKLQTKQKNTKTCITEEQIKTYKE